MNLDQGERDDLDAASLPQVVKRLLHDLQVHQVELEMQNEELRRTQLALDAERSRYFDLYELAPFGYCTLSEQGLILEANLTAAKLLNMNRSDLIRQPFSRFIVRADQDIYYLHRNKLVASGLTQWCELQMVAHDGTSFWAHLEASIAQSTDGVRLHRVVLSDIYDRKRLDEALQKKNLELEIAKEAAEKANQAKSDFLSSMSHELRSPLNAILGFAQLMESASPPPTPTQKGRIGQILQAGWYLLELINEILDLALIESGQSLLSLKPLCLADVLSECESIVQALADRHEIRVCFLPFDGACFVQADHTRLTQLVVNLLTNAIKYNRAGGTVDVTVSPIAGERLRLSVRDSGEGLSAAKLEQLFQPFNRLGQEATNIEGTGIGLVVCKRLVEMMGGAIGVESTPGVGSVFWVELNLATNAPASAPNERVMRQPALQQPGNRLKTLLYVEDNPSNLELVEQLVARRPDLQMLSALNGAQGIALARSQFPDMILMDVNLPGINGFEALKVLRENPATQKIPVLALSANAMLGDIKKGLAAGFLRYLTKPIKVDELMQALDLALEVAQHDQMVPASRAVCAGNSESGA